MNGIGLANLAALKSQIYTYEQLFADLNQVLVTRMTELQRDANRDFMPTVGAIMETVYDMCTTCVRYLYERAWHRKLQVHEGAHDGLRLSSPTQNVQRRNIGC